jgi:hypothetical protein
MFPFFLAGFVVVLLARGGWRHWRGLAAAAVAFAIVALPWYLIHRADLDESFAYADVPPDPLRWSAANAAWFTWSHLNWQLWLPVSLLPSSARTPSASPSARTRSRARSRATSPSWATRAG